MALLASRAHGPGTVAGGMTSNPGALGVRQVLRSRSDLPGRGARYAVHQGGPTTQSSGARASQFVVIPPVPFPRPLIGSVRFAQGRGCRHWFGQRDDEGRLPARPRRLVSLPSATTWHLLASQRLALLRFILATPDRAWQSAGSRLRGQARSALGGATACLGRPSRRGARLDQHATGTWCEVTVTAPT